MSNLREKRDEPVFGQPGSFETNLNGMADLEARRTSTTTVQGRKMSRIGPPPKASMEIPEDASSGDEYNKLVEMEANDAIKYRTCSWQKVGSRWKRRPDPACTHQDDILTNKFQTAALLFSEYICLAIMSFPYSYSILGLVPGIILTIVQAAFVLYTSLIVWQVPLQVGQDSWLTGSYREFCLRHPEVRDVCDIGQMLFWNSQFAWYFTAVMFLLNNTFIQGLHVLVISRYLNTMTSKRSTTRLYGENSNSITRP